MQQINLLRIHAFFVMPCGSAVVFLTINLPIQFIAVEASTLKANNLIGFECVLPINIT